jgi:hypothetical protein
LRAPCRSARRAKAGFLQAGDFGADPGPAEPDVGQLQGSDHVERQELLELEFGLLHHGVLLQAGLLVDRELRLGAGDVDLGRDAGIELVVRQLHRLRARVMLASSTSMRRRLRKWVK